MIKGFVKTTIEWAVASFASWQAYTTKHEVWIIVALVMVLGLAFVAGMRTGQYMEDYRVGRGTAKRIRGS